jgi:hypothetical protein
MSFDLSCIGKRCIIRGMNSGVQLGTVVSIDSNGGNLLVQLADARRIYSWDSDRGAVAYTLSEVATTGISTAKSRVNCNVPVHFIGDVVEIIPATTVAIASIEAATPEAK